MRSSSSITALHSAVESSRGSRRPEDDRQWTHARLHAYVSSQVRQIGASSPLAKWSTSFIGSSPCPRAWPARSRSAAAPPAPHPPPHTRPGRSAATQAARPRTGASGSSETTAGASRSDRRARQTAPGAAPPADGARTRARDRTPSVDAAHPVDRHVLHEEILLHEQVLLHPQVLLHELLLLFDLDLDLGLDDRIRHGSPFDDGCS